jgi:hypothetical protein
MRHKKRESHKGAKIGVKFTVVAGDDTMVRIMDWRESREGQGAEKGASRYDRSKGSSRERRTGTAFTAIRNKETTRKAV